MPLPIQSDRKKTGPPPACICGECSVCKNRERQKRFREKEKMKQLMGNTLDEEILKEAMNYGGVDE